MNSAIYSFSSLAQKKGYEVVFIEDGYQGLIEKRYRKVNASCLKKAVYAPGTHIGSSRSLDFKNDQELREEGVKALKDQGVEALVVLGGNGSYQGGELISKLGLPVILLPATIDNDVNSTVYTIGFFSALEEIGQVIQKIWYTANSHSQLTFVEVMGRDCSDLGVFASISSPFVEMVITQEKVPTVQELESKIRELKTQGRKGMVIVVVEKVLGSQTLPPLPELTKTLESNLGITVRGCVLGHTQRGAIPTTFERFVAEGFGRTAFECFESRELDLAIGFDGQKFYKTPLSSLSHSSKGSKLDLIEYKNSLAF
nr:6-phosphofructokinase [Candidatus Mycoplasma haematolamae]